MTKFQGTIFALMVLLIGGLIAACSMIPQSGDQASGAVDRAAVTTTLSALAQTWTASSGAKVDNTSSSSTVRLYPSAESSAGVGSTFSFNSTLSAGTYSVVVDYKQRNVYGIYSLKINGTQIGSTFDAYNSSTGDVTAAVSLGTVTLPATASSFTFTLTGKNASATAYDLKVTDLVLTASSGGATATPTIAPTATPTPTATPVGTTPSPTPTPTKTPAPTATPSSSSSPVPTGTQIVVAKSGGNFTTISAALASIPSGNTSPKVILVKNGTYSEINHISGKSFITIIGESRTGTIISATNNESLHSGTTNRAVLSFESGTDFNLENLTIHNTTTAGGSSKQAEAFSTKSANRVTLRQVSVVSWEDTLQFSGGSTYIEDSYIEGQIDFNWGTGVVYYNRCELRSNASNGYLVQPRNTGTYGFVFVDCKLTASSGVASASSVLARPMGFTAGQVSYVNCQMGTHIKPAGWQTDGISTLKYTEYQSKDLNGNTLDVSQRISPSRQLSASEATTMRNVTTVLGGWNPGVH